MERLKQIRKIVNNKELASNVAVELIREIVDEPEPPKVSVIVPVYNAEKHLDECIDSIVNQTLKDIEIICIDDCSTDNSYLILKEWAKKDKRIKVLRNKYNRGTGATINYGIRMADGEYIGEVDCDDFIDHEMYEYLYSISENADIVKSGYWSYYGDRGEVPCSLVDEKIVFEPMNLDYASRYMVFQFQPCFWSGIYRREFILQNGLEWNETEGSAFQDTSFIFKCNALCQKMVWSERSFYRWRCDEEHTINSQKYPDAVIYEYDSIERWLEERPELAVKLRVVLSRLRFGTYSWNVSRLKEPERTGFAKQAVLDLKRDIEYMDSRFYTAGEVKAMYEWIESPETIVNRIAEREATEHEDR